MEPRHRAPETLSGTSAPTEAGSGPASSTTRIRLLACCVLLTAVAFVQDPGLVVADTKLDLVLDPGRFLARAVDLWDPASAFGQLQNQAYGYLWPMGPFFWLGALLDLPGWVVQRLWWALLLCTAFVGTAKLVRALGVRSDLAVLTAAFAYALSPRLLTVLGPISIEAWPSALAPWVLLPLVLGAERGSPRRWAALSALAVAMVGGVNAAATFAVIPLGAVWLLTRESGPRRRALMLWWPTFVLLGTLWWLVPLFTLGAYSPPFLDFIESASITTYPTTLFDALRGTSNWVPYVSAGSRAGNDLVSQGYLAVMGAVLVAGGLVGVLDRRQPHRWFLSLSLLTGLVMVTAGHQGAVQGLFAGGLSEALDGALAPLRNVHKFDPVVRLPLVVGLAWTLERLLRARVRGLGRLDRGVAVGVVLVAVTVAASPALVTRLAPGGAFLDVPDYWRETAGWLERNAAPGTALLVPGSAFGDYVWGDPHDEPMQALARSSWAVRNQIPLTPPGNIRLLDRIERAFAEGEGSRALTQSLRRAGVRWLVVRGDLEPSSDVPDPAVVRQALADSPGLVPVRGFGPDVGGEPFLYDGDTRVVVNGGRQATQPAVEVWQVSLPRAAQTTTARPVVVAGGPEDLLDLEGLGVLGDAATVLAPDVPDGELTGVLTDAPVVLTDGLRERERNFARIHDGYGPVTTAGDERRTGNPRSDYLATGQAEWQTTTTLLGAAEVGASSSASDATATTGSDRGRLPYAAVDGDPATQWSGDPADPGADRWRLGLTRVRDLGEVTLTGGAAAADTQEVRVVTTRGRSEPVALGPGEQVTVEVDGPTDALEVVQVGPGRVPLALAEVEVPGVEVQRRLDLPRLPRAWGAPDAVVLRADLDPRRGCTEVGGAVPCTAGAVRDSEEAAGMARRFVVADGASYAVDLRVRPRPGPGLAELLSESRLLGVGSSSAGVPDVRGSALAAVDGDPGTAWVADVDDPAPALSLSWLEPQRLTGLSLQVPDSSPVARPTSVRLVWPDGSRELTLAQGRARFPAIETDQLRVEVTGVEQAVDLDFAAAGSELPAGVAELDLTGAELLPQPPSTRAVARPCGTGPEVVVAGERLRSALVASDAQLVAGDSLPARLCDAAGGTRARLDLGPGIVDVESRPSAAFELDSLVLARGGTAALRGLGESGETGSGLRALRHNANPGWASAAPGARAQVVDGWRQGWAVESEEPLAPRFAPQTVYRAGLLAGAVALLALVTLTLASTWRRGRETSGRPAPLAGARPSPWWGGVAALLGGALLAGVPGVLVAAVVGGGVVLLRRRRLGGLVAVAPAGLVVVASLAYLARPWGDLSGWAGDLAWPQLLALVPVLAALALALPDDREPPSRPRQRMAGSSTSR